MSHGIPSLEKLRRLQPTTVVGVTAADLAELVEHQAKHPAEPTWITPLTDVEVFAVDARFDGQTLRTGFLHVDNLPSLASSSPASLRMFATTVAALADRVEATS